MESELNTLIQTRDLMQAQANLKLTQRELECISLWIAGNTMKRIAQVLTLSPRTVETYLHNLKIKNGIYKKEEIMNRLRQAHLYYEMISYAESLIAKKQQKQFRRAA